MRAAVCTRSQRWRLGRREREIEKHRQRESRKADGYVVKKQLFTCDGSWQGRTTEEQEEQARTRHSQAESRVLTAYKL
eukprot:220764-Pleurochrysis_carterae.AAC.1